MNEARTISEQAAVERILEDAAWTPPPPPAALGQGPTAALREAMARFSSGPAHEVRRKAVERLLESLDVGALAHEAERWTRQRLADAPVSVDAVRLAAEVPTLALATALGVQQPGAPVVADVDAVAASIGRGEPATDATDAAADRLLAIGATLNHDPVAFASALYQNIDATRVLLLTALHAAAGPGPRRSAVVRTARCRNGESVVLDLRTTGLEFGFGHHACPGRLLAEAIVAGIEAEIAAARYRVAVESVACNDDGHPVAMNLERVV